MRSPLLLIALLLPLAACADDFGQRCSLPDNQAIRSACGSDPERGLEGTCAFLLSSQCSENVCGVYRASRPFCTQTCSSAESCPERAVCVSIAGSSEAMCVPRGIYDSR